jgi:hypothetical protein
MMCSKGLVGSIAQVSIFEDEANKGLRAKAPDTRQQGGIESILDACKMGAKTEIVFTKCGAKTFSFQWAGRGEHRDCYYVA